jgi:hypothetical protein
MDPLPPKPKLIPCSPKLASPAEDRKLSILRLDLWDDGGEEAVDLTAATAEETAAGGEDIPRPELPLWTTGSLLMRLEVDCCFSD